MRRLQLTVTILAALSLLIAASATPACAQTYSILYNFGSKSNDGSGPAYSGIIAQGRDGNLYTTTPSGGAINGNGAVVKITPAGTETVLYSFDQTHGSAPYSGLTIGIDGNFYGTTYAGGANSHGTVFKITPSGTLTALYNFTGGTDGAYPYAPPVQGTDGNWYGTTNAGGTGDGTVYKITPTGTLTTLYQFDGPHGLNPRAPLVLATDGNFYGTTLYGGANGDGEVFKITPSGSLTVLFSFDDTHGRFPTSPVSQGVDGNFYGTTQSGGSGESGVVFRMTPAGAVTVLHSLNGTTEGAAFYAGLAQASDGSLYGTDGPGPGASNGTFYRITTTGVFSVLHDFDGTGGAQPQVTPLQQTNGILYGDTSSGGTGNVSPCTTATCGVFYSVNATLPAFIKLLPYSGKVGSKIGILGQGFSASSVVKFNGVTATSVTLTGTTFLLATVPAGASDGYVTVTTGTTTLKNLRKFVVHNSWSSGKVMPTATVFSSAAVLSGEIYVIGGSASGSPTSDVQIYNPTTNAWSTGTALPIATEVSSAAVVSGILYVFGGDNGGVPTHAVWAYSPKTKAWSSMAAMPTARGGTLAVVEKNIVYVIGGNLGNGANFVATVESYNPATNKWTEEAPMLGNKDYPGGGLIGSTIVVADGSPAGSVVTGDTEGYSATTNSWSALTADPTARTGPCSGVIGSSLYDVAGYTNNAGAATTVNESFSLSTNKWATTLLPIPQGTMFAAAAVGNGQLYCFGGWAVVNSTAINNVQIYQP